MHNYPEIRLIITGDMPYPVKLMIFDIPVWMEI